LARIDEELAWAQALGFNSVRVFLHDLLWKQDAAGFLDRVDQFLTVAQRHGIGAMPVLFDSCWHPFPVLGPQRDPEPGVHNSGWVQSPGVTVLRHPPRFYELEDYVTGVVRHFRDDSRIQVWDIWNEPDNANINTYGPRDLGERKSEVVRPLLKKAFDWARTANPSQPLTSGLWSDDWSDESKFSAVRRLQLEESDVISFHHYGTSENLEQGVQRLKRYDRPLLCTEYMARPVQSTFQGALPVFKRDKVAAYCWGFVSGRSQTIYAWDSWQAPYPKEPPIWFHDILRPDGSPYREEETVFIRKTLGR
jgi:hypothetical protein